MFGVFGLVVVVVVDVLVFVWIEFGIFDVDYVDEIVVDV